MTPKTLIAIAVTTDPNLAVSDGLLSSLNTAAASKQSIPHEITGRRVGLVVIDLEAPWGDAYACMHACI